MRLRIGTKPSTSSSSKIKPLWVDKKIAQLLAQDGTHGVATEPTSQGLQWNPTDGSKVFDIQGEEYTRHILSVLEVAKFDISTIAMPFIGMGMIISGLQGFVCCAVASPSMVKAGGGDFGVLLAGADSGVLDKAPSILLKPGSSIYIPFGHVPILLALNKPKEFAQKRNSARSKKQPEESPNHAAGHLVLLPNKDDAKAELGLFAGS